MDEIDVEALLSELRTSLEDLVEQRLTVYRDSLYKKKRGYEQLHHLVYREDQGR